jgi:hypothetical protein
MSELGPDRCPICGGPNDCGMAAGKSECWCASVKISTEALEKVPDRAKGKVCVCKKCRVQTQTSRLSTVGILKGPATHE